MLCYRLGKIDVNVIYMISFMFDTFQLTSFCSREIVLIIQILGNKGKQLYETGLELLVALLKGKSTN